jgi:four helix bundle protein
MAVHNFRELNIWKRSMDLTRRVYMLTSELPDDEKFGLKSQINRSSVSIPSNIAEGSGRGTDKDFCRFLDISLGSSCELETQLILAQDLFKIETAKTIEELNEVQKMIVGFRNRLKG